MGNDLFGLGGLVKGLSAFMPKDNPDTKLFQLQTEINDMEDKEKELYAEIGKRVFPDVRDNPEFRDLIEEISFIKKKLGEAKVELEEVEATISDQKRIEDELLESRTCPNCSYLNPEGVKFCQECGEKLGESKKLKCPSCGTAYTAGARFCGECGSGLL